MKYLFSAAFLLCIVCANAQSKFTPTDQITIEGKVSKPLTLTIAVIDTFKKYDLPDIVITNHLGVAKNTLTKMKGVLLKDVLASVTFDAENPKVLSEYYFIFKATDNYKVVFSWNELYNTETGNNVYIVTDEGGKNFKDSDARICIISTKDFKTGRRDLKNLDKIIVSRAN